MQENVVGRTKADDIEMGSGVEPTNSHVAFDAVKDEQGNALEILRANVTYGRVGDGEMGTYFIGYCKTPEITDRMLDNTFLGSPRGNYDRRQPASQLPAATASARIPTARVGVSTGA